MQRILTAPFYNRFAEQIPHRIRCAIESINCSFQLSCWSLILHHLHMFVGNWSTITVLLATILLPLQPLVNFPLGTFLRAIHRNRIRAWELISKIILIAFNIWAIFAWDLCRLRALDSSEKKLANCAFYDENFPTGTQRHFYFIQPNDWIFQEKASEVMPLQLPIWILNESFISLQIT